ncbi:hypothetical protein [Fredinandcohnia onubensis]|uniref:hypothetical protein n=1 Tax=Fredinandcohnia onubensis TaxID=1571209 RepID=UPI000C0BC7BC|nr:hypothetical protein [Fredinandcohnia onubensis]
MTLRFTKKQLLVLFLSLIVIGGGLYLWYFVMVTPLQTRVDQKQTSLETEQKLLDIVLDKKQNSTAPVISSTELQKKIPVIPLIEQLLLELEKAETTSESKIISMSYSENPLTIASETDAEQGAQQNGETATEDSAKVESTASPGTDNHPPETDESNGENQQSAPSESTEQPAIIELNPDLINGLKQITVSLTVESPSYYELEKFLSVVEHQTRITKVDSINFTGQPELTIVENEPVPLVYTVTISTFYMPIFTEFAKDAPKVNFPERSNKNNPLTIGVDEDKEKASE